MKRILAILLLAIAAPASAQSFRGTLSNVARYIEIRPIGRDTTDTLQSFIPLDVEHAITTTHDLSLTGWGFGIEGVSFTALLRARTDAAGDFTWPRSDDHFDAILAYADYAREKYRIRAGRQRAVSGLGFYSFDGLDALFQATSWINLEAYAGRSLTRALEEPRHTALGAIEGFIPGKQVWLVGGAAEFDARGTTVGLRYQREILGDRSVLISERASLDLASSQLRPIRIEGAADYDVAFGHIGKAHLTGRLPLLDGRINFEVTGRRYKPFFELWTIWGMFSPIAYHEAEVQASWAISPGFGVFARAATRKYEDADAPVFPAGPKDDARIIALRARADATRTLQIDAEVRFDDSFGAYLGSGELSVGWRPMDKLRINGYLTAFQQILEFKVGEAAVLGFGGSVDFHLRDDVALSGGATIYQQRFENRASATDWNQKRGWLSLDWQFGRDPGTAQ